MRYDDQAARDYAKLADGENVLISAAAGSGKTYTLVERIVTKLKENPNASVDRFLIVTFTRAAAQELKERIANKLPENMEKQRLLLKTASIGTLDSFCGDICKKHFTTVGIDPNYEIDPTRVNIFQKEAIEEVLEEYYAAKGSDEYNVLREIVDVVCGIDGDEILCKDVLMPVLSYAANVEDPIKWMQELPSFYDSEKVWYDCIKEDAGRLLDETIEHINNCLSLVENEYADLLQDSSKYKTMYEKDLAEIEKLKTLLSAEDGLYNPDFKTVTFDRAVFATKTATPDEKDAHKRLVENNFYRGSKGYFNDHFNKFIGEKFSSLSYDERKKYFADSVSAMKKYVSLLSEICIKIYQKTLEKSIENNIFDFSQIGHFALKVLENDEICKEYRDKFDEVYVDEYQDTNMLQERIVTRVAKENNMFMVDDVKQSIYEFRRATPEFFMNKFRLFKKNEKAGKLLVFNKNFRSRNEVLAGVNNVFNVVMTEQTAGIPYKDGQSLNFGAEKKFGMPETDAVTNEYIIDEKFKCEFIAPQKEEGKKEEQSGVADFEKEATIIGNRIIGLIGEGFKFSDICILCKRNKDHEAFRTFLAEHGFPVKAGGNDNLLLTHEVQDVLSYLRLIDNPHQDIPVYTVLKSAFYGMSHNGIAVLRAIGGKSADFFDCAMKTASGNFEIADVLSTDAEQAKKIVLKFKEDLEKFRAKAVVSNVSDMAWEVATHNHYYNTLCDASRENVRKIIKIAASFDNGVRGGLYGFIRYIDGILKIDNDNPTHPTYTAATASADDNAISFMTVHKSKGLEFPVVILAGTHISKEGREAPVVIDEHLGVGVNFINSETASLDKSIPLSVLKYRKKENDKKELQRSLYVAMTRAEKKLIVTAGNDAGIVKLFDDKNDIIADTLAVKDSTQYVDLLKFGLSRKDAEVYWNVSYGTWENEATLEERLETALGTGGTADGIETDVDNTVFEAHREVAQDICAIELPSKLSVSQIKHFGEEEDAVHTSSVGVIENISILDGDKKPENGGMTFGTTVHKAMQKIISDRENWPSDAAEISKYVEKFADETYAELLIRFLNSKRAAEIKSAEDVRTEVPFTAKLNVEKYLKSPIYNLKDIAIQGVVDLYYKKEKGICIVDFKTDRTDDPLHYELTENYRKQLECYRDALSLITDEPVCECVLCFLRSGKEILV